PDTATIPFFMVANNSTGAAPLSAQLAVFICPSDYGLRTVGNGGVDMTAPVPVPYKWMTANYAAVFPGTKNLDANSATMAIKTALGPNYITKFAHITDGTSNTVIMTEQVRAVGATGGQPAGDLRGAIWIDEPGSAFVY